MSASFRMTYKNKKITYAKEKLSFYLVSELGL